MMTPFGPPRSVTPELETDTTGGETRSIKKSSARFAKLLSLQAKLKELQADTEATSREQAQKFQAKLDSLNESIKGGWDEVSDAVAGKLNEWLKND